MQQRGRILLGFSLLILLLLSTPLFTKPAKIPVSLAGSSTLNVLADRATISLTVSSEGKSQQRVADEVRQTTDEIVALLRPLMLPPNRTTSSKSSLPEDFLPPLASLSVNSFSANSYPRSTILGESTSYTSKVSITAEFRSLHPYSNDPNLATTRTVIPSSGFHHLALVLPSLAKMPRTKIKHLKWHLTTDHLSRLQSRARQNAMSEALLKASDYTAPMNLHFPQIRCTSFSEHQRSRRFEHYLHDMDVSREGIRKQGSAAPMYAKLAHDELDYGYEIEDGSAEAFGLEPQNIEVGSEVHGDFVVVERGLVRALVGLLL